MTLVEKLEALENIYYQGILEITIDGQTIKYASMGDLAKAIGKIKKEIDGNEWTVFNPPFQENP